MSRICLGACLGPGRFVVPPSNGTPMMPISMPFAFVIGTWGNRMKVAIPANLGVTRPDSG
jgi:hypothetical protein